MNITASVNYHIQHEKAQAFHFDVDGIVGNLVTPELISMAVEVKDVRGTKDQFEFARDGIVFVESESAITQFEGDSSWEAQYNQEIIRLLSQQTRAKEVIVFDHTVRVDSLDAERQPARNVHNDYNQGGACQRLVDLLGQERAAEFSAGHFGFVNVWRPIEQTITSSPLGFIRPSSMRDEDWMTIELIYPDRKGQILGVAFNPKHEWFYQSRMQPNEVVIFTTYDNKGRAHFAHSALDIVNQAAPNRPRKSIETRALVRYA